MRREGAPLIKKAAENPGNRSRATCAVTNCGWIVILRPPETTSCHSAGVQRLRSSTGACTETRVGSIASGAASAGNERDMQTALALSGCSFPARLGKTAGYRFRAGYESLPLQARAGKAAACA